MNKRIIRLHVPDPQQEITIGDKLLYTMAKVNSPGVPGYSPAKPQTMTIQAAIDAGLVDAFYDEEGNLVEVVWEDYL